MQKRTKKAAAVHRARLGWKKRGESHAFLCGQILSNTGMKKCKH
jgi:hypothetical protein